VNKLVFASAFLFLAPTLCAQQTGSTESKVESSQTTPQAETQPRLQNSNAQSNLPPALRPGHPLDPADVNILTGKRDKEIEASRSVGIPLTVGMSTYGGEYDSEFDVGLLPLTQIGNPFFFSRLQPRGFGRGGFGRGGFRGSH
jgi:hypothetical protein